jgi:hypothetical protein
MTHNEMASAIRNRIADGLDGNIGDQAFSLEQLYAEIDLQRADFAHKYALSKKLNPKFLVQELPLQHLVCDNLTPAVDCVEDFLKDPDASIPRIEIPKVSSLFGVDPIEYIGLNNMRQSFKVYYHPNEIRTHSFRVRTGAKPFVWIDLAPNINDKFDVWFFNMNPYDPLKFVKVRAIFDSPSYVDPNNPAHLEEEYPAPAHMQMAIIDALTEKWVRYYRQLQIPKMPNTQEDKVT